MGVHYAGKGPHAHLPAENAGQGPPRRAQHVRAHVLSTPHSGQWNGWRSLAGDVLIPSVNRGFVNIFSMYINSPCSPDPGAT